MNVGNGQLDDSTVSQTTSRTVIYKSNTLLTCFQFIRGLIIGCLCFRVVCVRPFLRFTGFPLLPLIRKGS